MATLGFRFKPAFEYSPLGKQPCWLVRDFHFADFETRSMGQIFSYQHQIARLIKCRLRKAQQQPS